MSSYKNDKLSILTKLNTIKNINDNESLKSNNNSNSLVNEIGQKIEKDIKKNDNNNDIFSELLNISNILLTTNNNIRDINEKHNTNKILNYSLISIKNTIKEINNLFLEEVKNSFFVNSETVCGTNKLLNVDTLRLSPKEFDFLNFLTINPTSNNGKLIYENEDLSFKEKVNKNLYNAFNNEPYNFIINGEILFTLTWDSTNQEYIVSNLKKKLKNVDEFLIDYYSNIEFFNLNDIIKTCIGMTLMFDNKESITFNTSLNLFNRIIKRVLRNCGNKNDRELIKNQTTLLLIDENDYDETFDFEKISDINLNDEHLINNGVIKFTDCDNIEVKLSESIIEDFIYFNNKKNDIDNILSTINIASHDVNEQQKNNNITIDLYYLSLLNKFILNIPKAIMYNIFSPKMLLPIVIIYKMFNNEIEKVNIKDTLKVLSSLFNNILKKIFWLFIKEFWSLIKIELINFVKTLVLKIIKNKFKRYYLIITSLIKLLSKLLENSKINSCNNLYSVVLKTIEIALNGKPKLNIPNLMLGFSDSLPGYSQDRAYINIVEKLEESGISLAPIYGDDNDLSLLIKSIIEGNSDELDQNSYISVTNKKITIPTPIGPIIIPPGILNSTGKLM